MTDDTTPVWFITGCSTGFGHDLAKQVVDRGWRAVVTSRDQEKVQPLVQGSDERGLALSLDVTNAAQIKEAVAEAKRAFGRIDVLVNNARLRLPIIGGGRVTTRRFVRSSTPMFLDCSR